MVPLALGILLASSGLMPVGQEPDGAQFPLIIVKAELPLYPGLAERLRIDGTVVVEAEIRDGLVVGTRVLSGEDIRFLAASAVENLKTWRFDSGSQQLLTITYNYLLSEDLVQFPENPHVELDLKNWVVTVTAQRWWGLCTGTREECRRAFEEAVESMHAEPN